MDKCSLEALALWIEFVERLVVVDIPPEVERVELFGLVQLIIFVNPSI